MPVLHPTAIKLTNFTLNHEKSPMGPRGVAAQSGEVLWGENRTKSARSFKDCAATPRGPRKKTKPNNA
jgi:hypothetical protein